MPKRPVETPITDDEIAFAHLVMSGKMTDREAAERAGIDPGRAAYVKAKPRVKAYMEEYRAAVRADMVQREVDVLSEFNISREQIIAQYWGFTRLEPERTNGNIAGQVRALDSLRDMLGFGAPQSGQKSDGEGEGEPKPQIYRAAWMRKPGDPDYEEDDGETAGSRETSTRHEPVMNSPEPSPNPATGSQSQPVRAGEPSRLRPAAGFGRFQGL